MSNLKQHKNVIVTTAVIAAVVCCTVILANVFAADRKAQELPALGQQTQGSDNGGGSLQEAAAMGSEDTAGKTSGVQPDSSTTNTQDTKENVSAAETTAELTPAANADPVQNEHAVRTLIEDFGKKLQMVSLLAPKEIAAKTIKENYGDFVTPELLQKWAADPQSAPGRTVSSPWPDRIDTLSIENGGNDQYFIRGEIIEITSVEFVHGGAAAKQPIELIVRKADDRWLISSVTLGEYVKRGPVKYENKQYGFDFYLPEDWKGYSIVEEKWEGTSGGNVIETGPRLLIRNPAWTQKDPHQDIPIMIFTIEQWNSLQNEKFFVSAAPIGPSKLGSNSRYVFALPPRYNFAYPTGYEEVEKIMSGSPLWPINPGMNY